MPGVSVVPSVKVNDRKHGPSTSHSEQQASSNKASGSYERSNWDNQNDIGEHSMKLGTTMQRRRIADENVANKSEKHSSTAESSNCTAIDKSESLSAIPRHDSSAYIDGFGRPHTLRCYGTKDVRGANFMSQDTEGHPGENDKRNFRAFGIEAYPTKALKNEVCLDFVHPKLWCPYSSLCHRIHPREKSLHMKKFFERERDAGERLQDVEPASICQALRTDIEHVNPSVHNAASHPIPRSEVQFKSIAANTTTTPSGHISMNCTSKKSTTYPPTRQPGWDPATGWWDPALDNSEWNDSDSSGEGVQSSQATLAHSVYPSSSRSSVTDEGAEVGQHTTSISRFAKRPETCRKWRRGVCHYTLCRYLHREMSPSDFSTTIPRYDQAQSKYCRIFSSENSYPQQIQSRQSHSRSRFNDVCRDWLQGRCSRGYSCSYIHEDLRYEGSLRNDPAPQSSRSHPLPPPFTIPIPASKPPEIFSTTIHNHIKIKYSDGFDICQVVTGFETSWIYVGNIPKGVKEPEITSMLKDHGEILDLRMPSKVSSSLVTVKARFSSASEASKACTTLNGVHAFDSIITARLTLSNVEAGHTLLNDTAVRIMWEAPGKVGYGGYATMEQANRGIEIARTSPYGKHLVRASIHSGMPAVGAVTVRFQGLPLDADKNGMKQFAEPEDVMWCQPNYDSHQRAVNGIKRMLETNDTDILEFEVMPPPYKQGMVVGWAHFSTPGEAKAACDRMHSRKPGFTGNTRILAQHLKSIHYSLTAEKYRKVATDIQTLASSAWRLGHGSSVTCVQRATFMSVKLCGEDIRELSSLKSELDIILSGEIVREDGKVVWDYFFGQQAGVDFVKEIERAHAPLSVQMDLARRNLRLSGSSYQRQLARKKIMDKVSLLRQQKLHIIPLDGHLIGLFMNDEFVQLQQDLGPENVFLDLWNHVLRIRGEGHSYDTARDAVTRAKRKRNVNHRPSGVNCPVCFDEVSSPISLSCGHSWCRTCLVRYLMTAVEQKFFPLTCLGNDAKCQEKIPLRYARSILPAADFDAIVQAAFSSHIHRLPDEFHFCPTPDCQQVYRAAPRVPHPPPAGSSASEVGTLPTSGTILQCPSCLARICASCQSEAHDGLACAEADGGESLFQEWIKEHDVKACPGCKMPIERAEGCHHVMCTMCHTHLCWECLATFPNGEGIYGHMRSMHGSFGLGPIE